MTEAYKKALEEAQKELAEAIKERDYWTIEVARLQQLVKSLAVMTVRTDKAAIAAQEQPDEVGLQEVVLTCVRASNTRVTAIDIRNQLQSVGYDLAKYANPLAVIHGALKRLSASGQIRDYRDGTYQRSFLYDTLLGTDSPDTLDRAIEGGTRALRKMLRERKK